MTSMYSLKSIIFIGLVWSTSYIFILNMTIAILLQMYFIGHIEFGILMAYNDN